MTEDEAKTKLCVHQPFSRLSVTTMGEAVQAHHNPRCVGSACAAWRWSDWREFAPGEHPNTTSLMMEKSKTDGFCGLAGKP